MDCRDSPRAQRHSCKPRRRFHWHGGPVRRCAGIDGHGSGNAQVRVADSTTKWSLYFPASPRDHLPAQYDKLNPVQNRVASFTPLPVIWTHPLGILTPQVSVVERPMFDENEWKR